METIKKVAGMQYTIISSQDSGWNCSIIVIILLGIYNWYHVANKIEIGKYYE